MIYSYDDPPFHSSGYCGFTKYVLLFVVMPPQLCWSVNHLFQHQEKTKVIGIFGSFFLFSLNRKHENNWISISYTRSKSLVGSLNCNFQSQRHQLFYIHHVTHKCPSIDSLQDMVHLQNVQLYRMETLRKHNIWT